MVQSRRRKSLLGALALVAGLAALLLIKFNVTGTESITVGPVALRFGTALAIGASVLALLGFLLSASSTRTGTGLPLLALLVCAVALLLEWKPNWFKRPAPAPAAKPLVKTKPAVAAPAVSNPSEEHRSKLFDLDSPSRSGSGSQKEPSVPVAHTPAAGQPHPALAARPDPKAAIRSARARRDAARAHVAAMLASSPAFQSARQEADEAAAELKKARGIYEPGSPELIAISRAALAARDKVEAMISQAALRDPTYLDAARELKSAEEAK